MPVEWAITERPLTIADLPEWIPAVLEPVYDQVLPALLGGDPVTLPPQMPTGLPATAAADLAAALAPERPARTSRTTPAPASVPVPTDNTMVIDEAGCARLLGFLTQIRDRRALRGRRYPLPYLLALPIVAMLAHHIDITAIAEWVTDAPAPLLLALGASTDRTGRPRRPDTKTITDALATHGEDYDRALCAFTGALAREHHQRTHGTLLRCLHVDGKAQKGATAGGGRTPMLLSARSDDGTVAAQRTVPVSGHKCIETAAHDGPAPMPVTARATVRTGPPMNAPTSMAAHAPPTPLTTALPSWISPPMSAAVNAKPTTGSIPSTLRLMFRLRARPLVARTANRSVIRDAGCPRRYL